MSKLYIVQRRTWYNEYAVYEDSDCIEGGGVAVAAFTSKKEAQAHAKKLEQTAWTEASSFFRLLDSETFADQLGVDEDQLCEAVRRLGLEPPEPVQRRYRTERNWPQWYDELAEELTPAQQSGLLKLFAKLKVYEVVEVPLED